MMKNSRLKAWRATAALFALAISGLALTETSANAVTSPSWQMLDQYADARTAAGGSEAYNPAPDATVAVWRGFTNSNLYFQSGYGDGRNVQPQQMPYASSDSAPIVTAVRDGWIILHRGTDNRIYFTTNVGTRGIGLENFPVWQSIQVGGQFQTTWDTPSVSATPEGNVTVAYRGTDGNLYTVEGQMDSSGNLFWRDSRALLAPNGGQLSSAWGPSISTLANGRQFLFWNDPGQGHAPYFTSRTSTSAPWTTFTYLRVPNMPQNTVQRPSSAAIGNTLEVAYLEADHNGQPVPSNAEGYNIVRTGYDAGRGGWANRSQTDDQGWRTNLSPSVNLLDEMHNVHFGQLLSEANAATIGRMWTAYKDVNSLF